MNAVYTVADRSFLAKVESRLVPALQRIGGR